MKTINQTTSFKRDFKKYYKDLKIKNILNDVLSKLINNVKLDNKYKNHPMKGNYNGYFDCHILPDLILIYEIKINEISLIRIGSHSDLF